MPQLSMKTLIRQEIVKRIAHFKPGDKIRRSDLRRDILATSDITKDIVLRLVHHGSKRLSVDFLLRRIDRIYSDALDSIDGIYIDYDSVRHVSWVVRDEIGSLGSNQEEEENGVN
jgi:hypothetical protein